MKTNSKFLIPFVRNKTTLKRILNSTNKIFGMYGGAKDLESVGLVRFVENINLINRYAIPFSLVLTKKDGYNSRDGLDLDEIPKQKIIIDDLNMLSKNCLKTIPTNLSTIFGFKTTKDMEKIIQLKEKYHQRIGPG